MDKDDEFRRQCLIRLVAQLGRGSIAQIAHKIGVDPTYVSRMKSSPTSKQHRTISGDTLLDISKHYPGWLSPSGYMPKEKTQAEFEHQDMPKESQMLPKLRVIESAEYVSFQRFTAPASAGHGAYADNYVEPFEEFNVARWWAQEFVGSTNTDRIKVVPCKGDSMAPTIPDGSMLFVDTTVRQHQGDGIYCINIDGRLLVKRVNLLVRRRALEVISDNPHGPKPEQFDMHEEERLCICGKVVAWLSTHKA